MQFLFFSHFRANEICQESKRQTISAGDVLKAIREIDFPEFVPQMEETLECKAACCLKASMNEHFLLHS